MWTEDPLSEYVAISPLGPSAPTIRASWATWLRRDDWYGLDLFPAASATPRPAWAARWIASSMFVSRITATVLVGELGSRSGPRLRLMTRTPRSARWLVA